MSYKPPPPREARGSALDKPKGWVGSHKLVTALLVLVVVGAFGGLVRGSGSKTSVPPDQTTAPTPSLRRSSSSSSGPSVDVGHLPIFEGHDGDNVVALVNEQGLVSAKVLGEKPFDCMVTAGNEVKWDKDHYVDTRRPVTDVYGMTARSLIGTFYGPTGTSNHTGYVFHADMHLQAPYPKAVVVLLECDY